MMNNERSCCLYTIKDKKGDVLYVGISISPINRLSSHFKEKKWIEEVADISIEWYKTEEEALKSESLRVWELNPRYNKVLNDIDKNLKKGKRLKDQCKTDFSRLCWDALSDNGGINYLFKKNKDRGFDYEHIAYFLKKGVVPKGRFINFYQRKIIIFLSSLSYDVSVFIKKERPDVVEWRE